MKILSCRLGKLQKEKHMTTAELSRRTGISKPTLYGYRINKRMPSYAIAYDMAMALEGLVNYNLLDLLQRKNISVENFSIVTDSISQILNNQYISCKHKAILSLFITLFLDSA
mgnify:CR=1 FL=1